MFGSETLIYRLCSRWQTNENLGVALLSLPEGPTLCLTGLGYRRQAG